MPEYAQPKLHAHPWRDPSPAPPIDPANGSPFVELSCLSNFSFLEGASHPEELVERAGDLGYRAIGIADRNTLAGAVRAFVAARDRGVRLVLGSRVEFEIEVDAHDPLDPPGPTGPAVERRRFELILLPTDLASYGRLCRLLSRGREIGAATMRREADDSGELFRLPLHALLERSPLRGSACAVEHGTGRGISVPADAEVAGPALHEGLQAIAVAPPGFACMEQWFLDALAGVARIFQAGERTENDRLSLAVWRLGEADAELRVAHMQWLSREFGIPLVAVNDVHLHAPERRPLQDVLTCVRHGCTIESAGRRLFPNAERHLRAPEVMEALFADLPDALARSALIAERCRAFSLDQIRYQYPSEVVPGGATAIDALRRLVREGVIERYPEGASPDVLARLEHELTLIDELQVAPYFLTVYDLVRFARSKSILCQGRGAAANSAVCFVLGITAVDPARIDMLFERFMSRERNEPPDIDVDFEHERREEVIQYVYSKYGRDRAAIAAEAISYRGRSAIRDVGKALGLGLDVVEKLAGGIDWWHVNLGDSARRERIAQIGLDPRDPMLRRLFDLAEEILGFPRHLSQHVGGFVITEGALCELVPVRAAAMPDRTIIEWDKDDLDAMGLMKVDVLALGMLTAIRKAIELINGSGKWGQPPFSAAENGGCPHFPLRFHEIPAEEPQVYEMISRADTVGVFQIESRAQMSMLPRLRPKCYYDLVIEVAIVRPGPIQGNMVHPYLRRRDGIEPITYPNETIRRVLAKTLGVPLFQEQAMSLAIVAAGFTPGEADALRRVIAAWKRMGHKLAAFGEKLINGMLERGYERTFAEQVFRQIQGFSGYGFPESHAASFALLVYVSSWIKCHHPAAFCAALLNSQPMGFYAPAQLVLDAKEHGVEVREIDVNASEWDCTLERENRDSHHFPQRKMVAVPMFPAHACQTGDGCHPALRLGLRQVTGLAREDADRIVDAVRRHGPFHSIEALWRWSGVGTGALRRLARADAFRSMGFPRQQALWHIRRLRDEESPLFTGRIAVGDPETDGSAHAPRHGLPPEIHERFEANDARTFLPVVTPAVEVAMDYGALGLSLKGHPMSFLRERLAKDRVSTCARVRRSDEVPNGSEARCAGIVLVRQRPATAKGILFMTIEDETGPANLIVKPKIYERYRQEARHSVVVMVEGKVERRNEVCHLLVRRIRSLDRWLAETEAAIGSPSRDFR